MTVNIRTHWHKLLALIKQDEVYITAPKGGKSMHWDDLGVDKEVAIPFITEQLSTVPKFVVDSDLLELVMAEGYDRSLVDMRRAGVMRLPYPGIIVEFSYADVHWLVFLRDQAATDYLFPWESKEFPEGSIPEVEKGTLLPFYGLVFRILRDKEGDYAVLSPAVLGIDVKLGEDGGPWIGVNGTGLEFFHNLPKLNEVCGQTYVKDGAAIYRAVAAAMLVMHTEGVVHEKVDTTKVNRKRLSAGKTAVPEHVVLRIGKVYRSGTSALADDYVPRKSPRPHWRRGHIRSVRFGTNRANVREQYIQPKLVAFKELIGLEPPPKEHFVTR